MAWSLVSSLTNGTCALRFYPDPAALCISDADASPGDSVFGSSFVLSLGFVATLVVTLLALLPRGRPRHRLVHLVQDSCHWRHVERVLVLLWDRAFFFQ